KRETETLILAVGAARGHERQGHVSHMLQSLDRKLSILGPRRIVVEMPDDPVLRHLFEKLGYIEEEVLLDLEGEFPRPDRSAPYENLSLSHVVELGGWNENLR